MQRFTRHRRLRFGLRSALAVLSLAALAFWLYWHGWPQYLTYREQREFEENVKQAFVPGRMAYDADVFGGLEHTMVGYGADGYAYVCRVWPNSIYVIYGPHKRGSGAAQRWVAFDAVEVFRLNAPPTSYSPQTEIGKWKWQLYESGYWGTRKLQAYLADFIEIIGGDRREKLGFQYELIHQVPVAKRQRGSQIDD